MSACDTRQPTLWVSICLKTRFFTSDPATELDTRIKAASGEKVSLVVQLNAKAFKLEHGEMQ